MEIINNIIPFKGFLAINLFGFIFTRRKLSDKDINHENIHTAQMKELLYIGFYIIYFLEWLYKVLFKYPFSHKAYRDISFEKEAYKNESNLLYLDNRKRYAQWKKAAS